MRVAIEQFSVSKEAKGRAVFDQSQAARLAHSKTRREAAAQRCAGSLANELGRQT